jgi:hypothetical protein
MPQFNTLSASQIIINFAGFNVNQGLAVTEDALSFSSNQPSMGLTVGTNAAMRTVSAAVTYTLTVKVVMSAEICSVFDAIRQFIVNGSSSRLPPAVQSFANAGSALIPFTFIPRANLRFQIVSTIWSMNNVVDMDVPAVGSNSAYRTFVFEFLDEPTNPLGSLFTS